MQENFLPLTAEEARQRGWNELDFVVVTGDAYVDHPSFGAAIIGRLVEALGFRVGMLSQPDFHTAESFGAFGRPKYAFLIGGGNVDSMVVHYTVAKRRRAMDEYTPGGKTGKRPDRAASVYTRLAKQAYPDVPVILGGLEASLRRFAHYDYWENTVLPSVLETSGADLLTFGMGERQTAEICKRLAAGEPVSALRDIAGVCYMAAGLEELPAAYTECAGYGKVSTDKTAYAKACRIQMDNQDCVSAKPVVQRQEKGYLVQNIPAKPLGRLELDKVFTLPFTRRWHPSYDALGGVPGLEEVEFSIMQNRGCFGGCNFCAITMHQGRRVTSRSKESILREAEAMTRMPGFKGYIHDIGGPTANFRYPSCAQQMKKGVCAGKKCLAPGPCKNLIIDHSEYLDILRAVRSLPRVKKVFIRSGIRYDYLIWDKDDAFFRELVKHHVSGQLKVAPEHCAPNTLRYMGKPPAEVFDKFCDKFYALTKQAGKKQYLVPYLMSSHPGSTLKDAVTLAEYLWKHKMKPEQVQDFYPTPGTVSTCMFYTGLDPYTMQPVYVAKDPEEKAMQRALLQYYEPKNRERVRRALRLTHREDLIPKLTPGGTAVKKDKGAELWRSPAEQKNEGRAAKRGKRTGAKRR
ncbi:MAG: YgiQ family radical SAM protein [Oscillospiraceae bacterium]|nr:YgiQ family radical SAM protein [Oscillospiraceae bacterium]